MPIGTISGVNALEAEHSGPYISPFIVGVIAVQNAYSCIVASWSVDSPAHPHLSADLRRRSVPAKHRITGKTATDYYSGRSSAPGDHVREVHGGPIRAKMTVGPQTIRSR